MSIECLKVRKLKYDLTECIGKFPTFEDFIKDSIHFPGEAAWFFDRLAASFQVEVGENQLMYHKRLMKTWATGPEGEKFFLQEATHGRYHHQLNKIIEPKYIKFKSVPISVNKIIYPFAAQDEWLYKNMLNPESEQQRYEAIKIQDLFFGAFETNFGILHAISLFEVLEDNWDQILKSGSSLVFLYLWVYHQIEEIEHVHVAADEFEKKYNESMYTKENGATLMKFLGPQKAARNAIFHQLALKYDYQFDAKDLEQIPSQVKTEALRSKFQQGVDLNHFKDQRRYYVELGDEKWMPALERHIGEWLSRQQQKKAA